MKSKSTRSVLFVCMGNICRSPAAEAVMFRLIKQKKLSNHVAVDSAGMIDYHIGQSADHRMRRVAAGRGYNITSRARQITSRDLDRFDLIIAMDRENLKHIQTMHQTRTPRGGASIRLVGEYLADHWPDEVPDPYYGGTDGFEKVLDMLEDACPRILIELVGSPPDAATQDAEGKPTGEAPEA